MLQHLFSARLGGSSRFPGTNRLDIPWILIYAFDLTNVIGLVVVEQQSPAEGFRQKAQAHDPKVCATYMRKTVNKKSQRDMRPLWGR